MDEDPSIDDDLELDDSIAWQRAGRIAFAAIESLTLFGAPEFDDALESALVPGTQFTRHRRLWLMGQVKREGRSLVGRLGFQTENVGEIWDPEIKDFREDMLQSGSTSPFAIDPEKRRVAFQLRPGLIRVKSFTGALQALMNEASPVNRWRVTQEREEVSFDDWAAGVDRISRLRVKLEPPNPHYGDRDRVKELVEGANARMTQVMWAADEAALDGLDVNDAFIREAIEHATKYGSYAATGERHGLPTVWGSDQESAAEQRVAETDPKTHEVPADTLRQQLGDTDAEATQ